MVAAYNGAPPFQKLLVANRGEIAVRIIQACRELGIQTVGVYSDADVHALHVLLADEAHCIGPAPASASYLNIDAILEVARRTGSQAIHPGYGFLAENAEFARACRKSNVTFVGPTPEAMAAMGGKIEARLRAERAGVPVVPGESTAIESLDQALAVAARVGYPVAIKASAGGGGRGLKVVRTAADMHGAVEAARREGLAYFKDATVFIERYVAEPRHVEVQILADRYGNAVSLGQRECSVQRNHQKLIEEAPALVDPSMSRAMDAAALHLVTDIGYLGAGTLEFLVDGGQYYFLEMNTRLQVEHTVTEMVTGLDIVQAQLRLAAGQSLWFSQSDVQLRGHAIECRVNAEDPAQGFRPAPSQILAFRPPSGAGVRLDSNCYQGYVIPSHYDSLIAKVVTWGEDREMARRRMIRALDEFILEGPPTTLPFHLLALQHPEFVEARATTTFVARLDLSGLTRRGRAVPGERRPEVHQSDALALPVGARRFAVRVDGRPFTVDVAELHEQRRPARSRRRADPESEHGAITLNSPMHGSILRLPVAEGIAVATGDVVCVIEAMKMENEVVAPQTGVLTALLVNVGDTVDSDMPLLRIEPSPQEQ